MDKYISIACNATVFIDLVLTNVRDECETDLLTVA